MTKHTQGNWIAKVADLHKSIKPYRVYKDTKIICELKSYDRYNEEANAEEEANAKLIASAPEMLEALQHALNIVDLWGPDMSIEAIKECDISEFAALANMKSNIENAIKKATE